MPNTRIILYESRTDITNKLGIDERFVKYPLYLVNKYNLIANKTIEDIKKISTLLDSCITEFPFMIPDTSNWLIENKVLFGDNGEDNIQKLVEIGVSVLVCLEDDVEEYKKKAKGYSYQPLDFIHISMDGDILTNIRKLSTKVKSLDFGNMVYINCNNGYSKSMIVCTILYSILKGVNSKDSLKYAEKMYKTRVKRDKRESIDISVIDNIMNGHKESTNRLDNTEPLEAMDRLQVIDFYDSIDNKYRPFSNFIGELTYEGKKWQTVEHAFHAQKFTARDNKPKDLDEYIHYINIASTAAKAKALGNQKPIRDYGGTVLLNPQTDRRDMNEIIKEYKDKIKFRGDWNVVKDDIMLKLVEAKIESNPTIKKILLFTGNSVIREASKYDDYWGTGVSGKGANMLGITLMKVRDKLLGKLREDKYYSEITRASYKTHPFPHNEYKKHLPKWKG